MAGTPIYGQGYIPASGAITNELNAVTRRAFVPKLVVQIYNAAPFLSMAMRNAQRARGGLNQVTVPIQGASFVQFGWSGYDGAFPQPTVQTALQAAAWNLSLGTVPIPLLGMESMTQQTEAVIPIVKARMNDAKTVAVQAISTALYSSAGTNALQINGLLDVYDDGTNVTTYGGISRTASPFWKAGYVTTSIAPTRQSIILQINKATKTAGGEKPDFMLMSLGDWTTLAQDFMNAEQFNTNPGSRYGNDDVVNAGFSALMLAGVPILADIFCPTGVAFLVNTKYLSLYISEDANFAFSGFHSLIPNNQIANVGVVITMMALVCTKPVSGTQLTSLTGSGF
jgi:hypothetical protein